MKLPLASVLALAALPATTLAAQERFTSLSEGGNAPPVVIDVELTAGGVTDLVETELAPLTPLTIPNSLSIARIGGQLWLGTQGGIFRYDETVGPARYVFVDQIGAGGRYLEISPTSFGAVAMRIDAPSGLRSVEEIGFDGVLIQSFAVDRTFDSIVPYQSGYLGLRGSTGIEVLDTTYQPVGQFAIRAQQAADAAGLGYFPDSLTVLSDGRVAIGGSVSIVIADSLGNIESVSNPGAFEAGAVETGGGLLVVPCADGLRLLDPDTLEAFEAGGALDVALVFQMSRSSQSTLPAASGRSCTTTPNSVGPGARIHLLGVDDSAVRTLSAVGTGMPAGTFALPIFGTAAFDAPYGDGRLCVSPFQQGITRGLVTQASALGSAQVAFDFMGPQTGASFLPGTTWHFQLIYRDTPGPAGFNGTDGVSIAFRP